MAALEEVMRLVEPIASGWKQMGDDVTPRLKAA
jgi:flagellin-specific chaperone FliS